MYEFLHKYSHKATPLPPQDHEPSADPPVGVPILKRNFKHVSRDLY